MISTIELASIVGRRPDNVLSAIKSCVENGKLNEGVHVYKKNGHTRLTFDGIEGLLYGDALRLTTTEKRKLSRKLKGRDKVRGDYTHLEGIVKELVEEVKGLKRVNNRLMARVAYLQAVNYSMALDDTRHHEKVKASMDGGPLSMVDPAGYDRHIELLKHAIKRDEELHK